MQLAMRWIMIAMALLMPFQGGAAMAMPMFDAPACHHGMASHDSAGDHGAGGSTSDDSEGVNAATPHQDCCPAAFLTPVTSVSTDAVIGHSAAPIASPTFHVPDRPKRPPLA